MTCRADLKICGTKNFYPMILVPKSIILSVLRYMRVIPGVFRAFWGDFWEFSPSLSKKWCKMVVFQKTKKFDFSNFFVQKWVEWPGLGKMAIFSTPRAPQDQNFLIGSVSYSQKQIFRAVPIQLGWRLRKCNFGVVPSFSLYIIRFEPKKPPCVQVNSSRYFELHFWEFFPSNFGAILTPQWAPKGSGGGIFHSPRPNQVWEGGHHPTRWHLAPGTCPNRPNLVPRQVQN